MRVEGFRIVHMRYATAYVDFNAVNICGFVCQILNKFIHDYEIY
jgi:hypothetical protein